jgi:hypothetical protein
VHCIGTGQVRRVRLMSKEFIVEQLASLLTARRH